MNRFGNKYLFGLWSSSYDLVLQQIQVRSTRLAINNSVDVSYNCKVIAWAGAISAKN